VFTLYYRHKALISIYVYAFLVGFIFGFNTWWYPYLYIWTILWALIMLIPKKIPLKWKVVLATIFCALHGMLYGTLYAPFQALVFGLTFEGMLSWIVVGLPWDVVHMCGNIALSVLIAPLYKVIEKLSANQPKKEKVQAREKKKSVPNNVQLDAYYSNQKRYYLKVNKNSQQH
jgi:energy-coupling factor transport system substrate-specific component